MRNPLPKFNSRKATTPELDNNFEEKIRTELEAISLKYSVVLAHFSISLYPLWGLFTYYFVKEGFAVVFGIQVVHSIITILLICLTRKFRWKAWPINCSLAVIPIEIAYMCNIVNPTSLFFSFVGYSCVYIIGALFVVWRPVFTFIVWSLTIIMYLVFHYTISSHVIQYVIGNGGLFFFTVSTASMFFAIIRYDHTKDEVMARIMISKANERLKELDRAKTNFFTNISHEFRTPLTLILGPLEVMLSKLSQKNSMPVDKDDIRTMHRNSIRLLKLVNNLLDFSRIEAGKMKPEFRKTNVTGQLKNHISTLESAIRAKNITLNTTIEEDKLYAYLDRGMFEKIIMNLLSNAYKFTDEGGEINVKAWEEKERILIRVSDTGGGIPEDKLFTIFDRFSQGDSSIKRRYEGTGIGLSLVKELLTIHKGEISVKSDIGKGTAFTICLNKGFEHLEKGLVMEGVEEDGSKEMENCLSGVMTEPETDRLRQAGKGRDRDRDKQAADSKVLIVEDNDDMVQFISSVLRDQYEVHTAFNGMEGLRKVKEIRPDLVLSDIMMPEMDGYKLVERIRKDKECSTVPIILLTAKADIPDKLRGFRKGANDYIAKPFNTDELCARINSQLKLAKFRDKVTEKHEKYKEKKKNITEITKMKIDSVMEYITKNFKDNMTREELAEIVDISPDHLSRTFLHHTGEKLNNMINRLRIEYAAEQMLDTDQKIIEIAFDAGFNDLSTFNRIFQKIKSIPPSEYRKTEKTY
jgi:signal transduction histidine kinase/DNA-binding response OmpR family regulator